jgi:3-oxo-5alpha-steroid 4-dehydrogenase
MGGGRLLMDILEKRVREVPTIDVQCSVRVLCLVQDEDGAVQGVVARIDGVEKFVRASKGVVLCAGGFCMNRDMVRRYCPDILITEDAIGATDDGSGALMGMSAGGDAIHMDQYFTTCPWYPPESLVKGIFVNIRGQRFINEDCYHGRVSHYMSRQPDGRVFLLVDNETFGRPEDYAKIDLAATGETWDEVEAELGLAKGSLVGQVNFYNEYAAKGEDPQQHKAKKWLKPLTSSPFAAFELKFGQSYFSYFTLGGLNARPTGEVLDRQGQPVPGLYAAGRTTSGLPRWGEGYSSGMSLADCTFFGRQAGKTVAAAPSRK